VIEDYERFFNLPPGSLTRLREHALVQRAEQEARTEAEPVSGSGTGTGSESVAAAAAGMAARAGAGTGAGTGERDGAAVGSGAGASPPPRLLPAAIEYFPGRAGELTHLDRLLRGAPSAAPVVISAVSGMGGIGKTTLAVYWAHQARDSFPD